MIEQEQQSKRSGVYDGIVQEDDINYRSPNRATIMKKVEK